ncbi:MAG: hypothetical protein OXU49_06195 [Cyanobacteria bacterium MAG STY2_bin_7]|nr:hypothetical protein [Cyanobacteria bacterium MAG STY2_bin_7]
MTRTAATLLTCFALVACTTAGTQHERQSRTAGETTEQHVEIIEAVKDVVEATGRNNAAVAEAAASGPSSITNFYYGNPDAPGGRPWFESTGVDGMCFPDQRSHDEFARRSYCRENPVLRNCTQFTIPCSETTHGEE